MFEKDWKRRRGKETKQRETVIWLEVERKGVEDVTERRNMLTSQNTL